MKSCLSSSKKHRIEVVQLAQAHKWITTGGFASTDAIGGGTLTIAQGTDSFSLIVAATDTLEDVRDAINAATNNSGVAASIINVDDGSGDGTMWTLKIISITSSYISMGIK